MIHYQIGDATRPDAVPAVIVHVCNDVRAWGAGFVLALSRRWPQPEAVYRAAPRLELGEVQFVRVEPKIHVANMICQRGIGTDRRRIDYHHLESCLAVVADAAREATERPSIHMPRIGCGLAGGRWEEIEAIVNQTLVGNGLEVYVYDLPGRL